MGFLFHWLTVLAPESDEHPPDKNIQPSREERIVARLALADIPGSEALFVKEAPLENPEDGEEPDECPWAMLPCLLSTWRLQDSVELKREAALSVSMFVVIVISITDSSYFEM
jgi:hypothetical protein